MFQCGRAASFHRMAKEMHIFFTCIECIEGRSDHARWSIDVWSDNPTKLYNNDQVEGSNLLHVADDERSGWIPSDIHLNSVTCSGTIPHPINECLGDITLPFEERNGSEFDLNVFRARRFHQYILSYYRSMFRLAFGTLGIQWTW